MSRIIIKTGKIHYFLSFQVFFLLLLCTLLVIAPAGADNPQGKILVAVYASGGSLESEYGLITEDLGQMVAGTSNTSPKTMDVIVAYGGANKTGWKGMTIANRSQIADDLADGKIGDGARYLNRSEDANMGSSQALSSFLTYVRDNYRYDRVFLILIGHGEAYTGMLFDENHQDDGLTVPELGSALRMGGFNVELIGFDSCLMSCLEVATTVQGYARYMIASEESEPAEGWNYRDWFEYLASHPEASVSEHGVVLLDGYMKGHEPGKTLSLLDLRETGLVTQELEQLSHDLIPLLGDENTLRSVEMSINRSQQFGLTDNGTLEEATLDLYDLAVHLNQSVPYLSGATSSMTDAIDRMVILSRHDELEMNAHGIAIISPVRINSGFYRFYQEDASITPGWNRFIQEYLRRV